MTASQSPLDVPGVRSDFRPGELVAFIREERERSGERILSALSDGRPQPAPSRPAPKGRQRRRLST